MSTVTILYSPNETGRLDEEDSLVEKDTVQTALEGLGYMTQAIACHSHNLVDLVRSWATTRPDIVFNIVEALDGRGKLIHVVPFMLDNLNIPYTGSPAQAIYWTSNKLASKKVMRAHHLPTPDWIAFNEGISTHWKAMPKCIIKSVWEHASFGLDESSIIDWQDEVETKNRIAKKFAEFEGDCFAEAFIEGREFNLSMIEQDGRPVVLPIAEMDFVDFEDRPQILTYSAKWDEHSFEYHHTQRKFAHSEQDLALFAELKRLSLECWEVFHLKGYARVDFRVDLAGRPYILEINVNPCISKDSGFVAACAQLGISYEQVIENVLRTRVLPAENRQIAWGDLLPSAARTAVPKKPVRKAVIRRA